MWKIEKLHVDGVSWSGHMRVGTSVLALALFGAATGHASACIPASPTEDLARDAQVASVGIVTSSRMVEEPSGRRGFGLIVNVQITRRMFGRDPDTVEAISPCYLPLKAGEEVIVATFGNRRFAYPASMYGETFRDVYGPGW